VIGKLYRSLFEQADRLNRENILEFASQARTELGGVARMLDLGCDDGDWTMRLANGMQCRDVSGVEIIPERAKLARDRGVQVVGADLSRELPFSDGSFDVVHANQVIEHVSSIDLFLAEIHRVTRPGGFVIVSSENGSAWHNVAAAALGWQIFSLTNVSARAGAIGNPLALHRSDEPVAASWTHKTIFNFQGFKEIFEVHGFSNVKVAGAGYHPLPAIVGRWEPRHSHFITAFARK
jgi:ubiquinone/menaquinone biosynthesis C-methylase UbiE